MPWFGKGDRQTEKEIGNKLGWQAYERVKAEYDEVVRRLTSLEQFDVFSDGQWYRVTYTLSEDDNGK